MAAGSDMQRSKSSQQIVRHGRLEQCRTCRNREPKDDPGLQRAVEDAASDARKGMRDRKHKRDVGTGVRSATASASLAGDQIQKSYARYKGQGR
jgi:hypothetical protein